MTLASADRCSEDVGVIAIVISELEFRDVQMQILPTNLVESANNAALQDRPEAFNRVRMDCTNDTLANRMVNGLVREAMLQPNIAGISICASKLTRFDTVSRALSVFRSVLSTTRATTLPLRFTAPTTGVLPVSLRARASRCAYPNVGSCPCRRCRFHPLQQSRQAS